MTAWRTKAAERTKPKRNSACMQLVANHISSLASCNALCQVPKLVVFSLTTRMPECGGTWVQSDHAGRAGKTKLERSRRSNL